MIKCEYCDSTDLRSSKNGKYKHALCGKHLIQFKRHGEILKRTKNEANELIVEGDKLWIIVYTRNGIEKGRVLTDSKHIDMIKLYKWGLSCQGKYVRGNANGKAVYLHRLITNCPDNMVVDHINNDKTDNREANLRICTQQQNTFNKSMDTRNTSGITGVRWDTRLSKWLASIKINRKFIHLGCFVDKQDAIDARLDAQDKYFGEYAFNGTSMPNNATL